MEQFSLEKYLANPSRKVVTRDGCPVRILCTDKKSYNEQIVGLIMSDTGMEHIFTWTQQGKQYININDAPNDLFFAPEKHEGWINIHRSDSNGYYIGQNKLYNSKEEADEVAKLNDSTFIKTLKIEWKD